MIIVEAFQDGLLYFGSFFPRVEIAVEMSRGIMEDIGGKGGLFHTAGDQQEKDDKC
jgi:hypothetical protein